MSGPKRHLLMCVHQGSQKSRFMLVSGNKIRALLSVVIKVLSLTFLRGEKKEL